MAKTIQTKRETWLAKVQAWRASGMSAREFAQQHHLNIHTLKWWAQELKNSPGPLALIRVRPIISASDVPIGDSGDGVSIRLVSGAVIEIGPRVSLDLLRKLFEQLGHRPC